MQVLPFTMRPCTLLVILSALQAREIPSISLCKKFLIKVYMCRDLEDYINLECKVKVSGALS